MSEFNLIDEDWIPCIDSKGTSVEYGISDTLLKAHELREICDDSPLVTVAIHRLLLAVLYRAFQGPSDFKKWKELYEYGAFDERVIEGYLINFKPSFYLFSPDRPFYQMGRLETSKPVSVSRLATESASGNNATMFDHCSDDYELEWSPARATRQLVACQSFALGFGRSGNAKINGVDEVLPYSADGIALRGLNIWLQGLSLFETLMINLSPVVDSSLPPWELENTNQYRDKLQGKNRMKPFTSHGVVDRLTWQSRLIKLIPKDSEVSNMYFTHGRSADKSVGDPMKVYRTSKEEGIYALSLNSGKAAWRDAHSLLMIPSTQSNEHRPECFNLIARAQSLGVIDTSRSFTAHIVGLATAPNKAAKFLLWRHERLPVPIFILNNVDLIERLGLQIKGAENAADELRQRSWRISRLYLAPDCESPNARQPEASDVTNMVKVVDPRPAFWSRMEEHFFMLLQNLSNDWDSTNDEWKPDDQQTATIAWRNNIKWGAERALKESIRSLGTTARAIQAIARVSTDFNDDDLKSPQTVIKAKRKTKGGTK